MPLDLVLAGLGYVGQVSIRRHGDNGVEYLGGGTALSCIKRFGNYDVKDSCNMDGILIIYVEQTNYALNIIFANSVRPAAFVFRWAVNYSQQLKV